MYTTASAAYVWVGELIQVRRLFGVNSHCVEDGQTDGSTEQPRYGSTELFIESCERDIKGQIHDHKSRIGVPACR